MSERFPPIEPHASGLLDVGDGQQVYWEASGNPAGRPALVVHGGPGSGTGPGTRRNFDPERYLIVQFDQRGCGRSLPHAGDPAVSLDHNTTHHLIADMEALRRHLGIDRWLLYGGSWGSTLILAYAERHPERVSAVVLVGVTMTRPEETDWLYHGVGRFVPAAWAAFRDALPPHERTGNLVAAYDRLLNGPEHLAHDGTVSDGTVNDLAELERLAASWVTWEDAVISHENLGSPGQYSARVDAARMAFVRICAHYFAHDAWLKDGELLRDAHRLAGIPAVLIHGRLDLGSPLRTAWELAQVWPDAELQVIDEAGHTGSPVMRQAILAALARFAADPDPTPDPA